MSIELVDIHKAFGEKQVLKGLTLTIRDGETTTVIGGSGSGKSVALKHIVGLIHPDRGEVWVDGENVGRLDQEAVYVLRRRIGYVFQFAALFDSMTIEENVGLGLRRMEEFSGPQISERVAECLAMVDLEGVFEISQFATRTDQGTTKSSLTNSRPFFLLRSTNPVLSPGVGYFRREGRSRTAGQSETL